MSMTIYALFLCWQGISQPCTYVDALPYGPATTSLSECRSKATEMNLPRATEIVRRGGVESAGPHPYYRCMSRTVVPAWHPAG